MKGISQSLGVQMSYYDVLYNTDLFQISSSLGTIIFKKCEQHSEEECEHAVTMICVISRCTKFQEFELKFNKFTSQLRCTQCTT